jgi:hypothetical protein
MAGSGARIPDKTQFYAVSQFRKPLILQPGLSTMEFYL